MGHKAIIALKRCLRILGLSSLVVFVILSLFAISLFFREQSMPRSWVKKICRSVSTPRIVVTCEKAAFGWRNGLHLKNVRVYDVQKKNSLEPMASVDRVSVRPLPWRVRLVGLRYQKLPETYYQPGYNEANFGDAEIRFPALPPFQLTLVEPRILGLSPESVTGNVEMYPSVCHVRDIRLVWPDLDKRMSVAGFLRVDLERKVLESEIEGLATQRQIRPFIEAIDITSALPYMDAFTAITEPVPSKGVFRVDLVKGDFHMELALSPTGGRYRGVPLEKARGVIEVDTQIRENYCNVYLDIRLPEALDIYGRKLNGRVRLEMVKNKIRLDIDGKSGLDLPDILQISEVLDPNYLTDVVCETPPIITCHGRTSVTAEDSAINDLRGDFAVQRGRIFGFELCDAKGSYHFKDQALHFLNINAKGKESGKLNGRVDFDLTDFEPEKARFSFQANYKDGTLGELADFFSFDSSDRTGLVNANFSFEGPLSDDVIQHLKGKGHATITKGHLARLKIFAGLTKELAQMLRSVDYLTNLSDASADFVVENGVLKTDNIVVEGAFITILGKGEYDMIHDQLNFSIRVKLMQEDSFLGYVIRPITWPFTMAFLKFKVTGSLNDPQWDYQNPMGCFGGLFEDSEEKK